MKVLAIQHSPIEPLGLIEDYLTEKNVEYEYVRVFETNEIDVKNATHVVILGGPMGAYEDEKYGYLKQEKEMIRESLKSGRAVLGICLGAQLIAAALGKRVYPFKTELGWYEVKKIGEHTVFSGLPERLKVFQWHNDTFDLPDGAKLVYAGEEVRNQAFVVGKLVGVQYHIEVTKEIVETWVKAEKSLSDDERKKIVEEGDYEALKAHTWTFTESFLKM